MEKDESMVLVLKYGKADKATIEKLVENFSKSLNAKDGTVERVYQGNNKKVISALESILDLTTK